MAGSNEPLKEFQRLLIRELMRVRGATFGSMSTETFPGPGITKTSTGVSVILFSTDGHSGYEAMVKRRLVQAGQDPSGFVVDQLPWGKRVGDSPVIEHNGRFYVQVVVLDGGETRYFKTRTGRDIDPEAYGLKRDRYLKQGLPEDSEVIVACYALEHVVEMKFLGATFTRPDEASPSEPMAPTEQPLPPS